MHSRGEVQSFLGSAAFYWLKECHFDGLRFDAVSEGGLGFGYKWDMDWMNDTLDYYRLSPQDRSAQYHKITFSMMYFLKAEYYQLKIRREKLMDFLDRWTRGALINDYYVTLGRAPQSLCSVAFIRKRKLPEESFRAASFFFV